MEKRFIFVAAGIAAALVAVSVGTVVLFGGSGDETATSMTRAATPATTAAASTTTAATTTSSSTTTPLPGPSITLTLSGSGRLQQTAEDFYAWLSNREGVEAPPMAEGLAAFLAEATVAEDLELAGEFATAALSDETEVAVVTAGEDVLLAADEGEGWRIVGAKLASLGLEPWYGEPVRFVMIVGTDARPGYIERVFRGDSLHLLTSNIGEASGAVVGFPRDAWVEAPYGRMDKLTHVNAIADSAALVQVVRDLTGLPVEGYIVTGFKSFRHMVDAFGGVVVDVPFAMNDPKSSAFLVAGEQTLLGQNALAFSRNRSIQGGDFTRSFHQGMVIVAALDGVQQRGILDLPDLLRLLSGYTWTDLSTGDLLTLAAGAYEIDPAGVPNLVLPGSVATIGGASVVLLDESVEETYRDLDDGIITPVE
ncbi:MAG: LCP family protein [Actinomycetota bacterium]